MRSRVKLLILCLVVIKLLTFVYSCRAPILVFAIAVTFLYKLLKIIWAFCFQTAWTSPIHDLWMGKRRNEINGHANAMINSNNALKWCLSYAQSINFNHLIGSLFCSQPEQQPQHFHYFISTEKFSPMNSHWIYYILIFDEGHSRWCQATKRQTRWRFCSFMYPHKHSLTLNGLLI